MRLLLVLRKELYEGKKSFTIYGIVIFLFLFFQEILDAYFSRGVEDLIMGGSYAQSFPPFLFLGGCIMTSVFFAEDMFSRTGQHAWLMLPAASWEKFLAKALLCAIAYPIALTALFVLSSLIIEALTLLIFDNSFSWFNPFSADVGILFFHYLVIQSVFLLGSTYFRKAHFIKTVLSVGLVVLSLLLLGALFIRIAFAPYIFAFLTYPRSLSLSFFGSGQYVYFWKLFFQVLYWIALPVFCWICAYLRVKEVQATDAV